MTRGNTTPARRASSRSLREQQKEWRGFLRNSRDYQRWLQENRGITLATQRLARVGFDFRAKRYTIPVFNGKRLVGFRKYKPKATERKWLGTKGMRATWYKPPIGDPAANSVLITEGELDALLAAQETAAADLPGRRVLTSTGGAKFIPRDLSPLEGKNVYIAYDCDDAGIMGARKLAKALLGKAASVHTVSLGLAEGEDVTDWFMTYDRTAADLWSLAEASPAWTPSGRRDADELLRIAVERKVTELGSRNEAGFWLAGQLRDERYSRDEATEVMLRFQEKVTGLKDHPYTDADVRASIEQVYSRPPREPSGVTGGGDDGNQTIADKVVEIALEKYRFGQSDDGRLFAVPHGGHVIRPLQAKGSSRLLDELANAYRLTHGKVISSTSLDGTRIVMRANAAEAQPEHVGLRVARCDEGIVIDLGDVAERVVIVTPNGWRVDTHSSVLFRRTPATGAFPTPVRGGDIDELRELINVPKAQWDLLVAELITTFIPDIPHAVLAVQGEQGTAKTDATRMLVMLVDPSPVPLRKLPKSHEEWHTAASGSWVIALENVSHLPEWLSDAICAAVTGVGDVRRQLYTDDSLVALPSDRRVVMLNGIEIGGIRSDLADRTLRVELRHITKKRRLLESEVENKFNAMRPRLFGALLDLLSKTLAVVASGEHHLAERPRMADFAEWVNAVDQVRGTQALAAYLDAHRRAAIELAEDDPVVVALRKFLGTPSIGGWWRGEPAQLLENLNPGDRRPRTWPESPRSLGRRLSRLAPNLREGGWKVKPGTSNSRRVWTLALPGAESRRSK